MGPVDFRVLAALEFAMLIVLSCCAIREFRRPDKVPEHGAVAVTHEERVLAGRPTRS
ncbi:hypothetical protein AB0L41_20635 [Amycolatopsis mediterranei]|uniref:hypothetical protein n=1 Tax=Amycolatopsis mediterranei TaxID=33910 RepID=UPI0034389807